MNPTLYDEKFVNKYITTVSQLIGAYNRPRLQMCAQCTTPDAFLGQQRLILDRQDDALGVVTDSSSNYMPQHEMMLVEAFGSHVFVSKPNMTIQGHSFVCVIDSSGAEIWSMMVEDTLRVKAARVTDNGSAAFITEHGFYHVSSHSAPSHQATRHSTLAGLVVVDMCGSRLWGVSEAKDGLRIGVWNIGKPSQDDALLHIESPALLQQFGTVYRGLVVAAANIAHVFVEDKDGCLNVVCVKLVGPNDDDVYHLEVMLVSKVAQKIVSINSNHLVAAVLHDPADGYFELTVFMARDDGMLCRKTIPKFRPTVFNVDTLKMMDTIRTMDIHHVSIIDGVKPVLVLSVPGMFVCAWAATFYCPNGKDAIPCEQEKVIYANGIDYPNEELVFARFVDKGHRLSKPAPGTLRYGEETMVREFKRMAAQLLDTRSELYVSEQKAKVYSNAMKKLEKRMEEAIGDIAKHEQEIKRLKTEIKEINERWKHDETEWRLEKKRLKAQIKQKSRQDSVVARLRQNVQQLSKTVSDKDTLLAHLTDQVNELQSIELQQKLEESQDAQHLMQERLNRICDTYQREKKDIESKLEETTAKNAELETEWIKTKAELEETTAKNAELETEWIKTKAELDAKNAELETKWIKTKAELEPHQVVPEAEALTTEDHDLQAMLRKAQAEKKSALDLVSQLQEHNRYLTSMQAAMETRMAGGLPQEMELYRLNMEINNLQQAHQQLFIENQVLRTGRLQGGTCIEDIPGMQHMEDIISSNLDLKRQYDELVASNLDLKQLVASTST